MSKDGASKKYSELDRIAFDIAQEVSHRIEHGTRGIKSKMPYKNQYVLEELIRLLKNAV